jgi:hypothetical protein
MSRTVKDSNSIEIELMRGGDVVSTLTGAFGQSLKETRLTAVLGYLIALHPEPFLSLFGFRGVPQRVCLETRHDQGRSDILVETSAGTGIIEAKVDATDPLAQSRRYASQWIALLTHRVPRMANSRVRYVSWQQLAFLLERLSRSGSPPLRLFSRDLLGYMQVHHMTRDRKSVEIYAREINEPMTLALFLQAQIYGCIYQAGSRLAEALYFAPHFGKSITNEHPGVNIGISYVAQIESVGNAVTWQEFKELMFDQRGGVWWNHHKSLLNDLHQQWTWSKGKHRSFLLLGKPRLVFNPPVRKENLQRGKGWLSKRFYSFDELFVAWGE